MISALALQDAADRGFFDLASTPNDLDVLGAWLISFFTLAVFSFLYKDNPFYKLAEHVFVGAGTAYFTLKFYKEGLLEPVFDYVGGALEKQAAEEFVTLGGYEGVDPSVAIGVRVIAGLFALMLLVRLFKPDSWAPRWPLAIMVGVYAALKMTGETQAKLVLPVQGLMKPLTDPTAAEWSANWIEIEETQVFYTFSTLVVVVGTIAALSHFIFTYRRTPALAGLSRLGVIVLMITFGSMFGFTVLGRIALLIDRVDSLGDVSGEGYQLAGEAGSTLAVMTSPPVLIAALITLVLVVGKLSGKDDDGARSI